MLAQAKIKASEAGLEISFIEADIRTLNLPEKYDFIFIPFNSIHPVSYTHLDVYKRQASYFFHYERYLVI